MRSSSKTTLLSGVASACASVVCMGSMGAMAAGSAAGMSGMGAAAASAAKAPAPTRLLEAIGLGSLTHVPNAVLQPLLILLLLVAIASASWRARRVRTIPAVGLAAITILAGIGLYVSIYVVVSSAGYWLALAVLILASFLSLWSGRRRSAIGVN